MAEADLEGERRKSPEQKKKRKATGLKNQGKSQQTILTISITSAEDTVPNQKKTVKGCVFCMINA